MAGMIYDEERRLWTPGRRSFLYLGLGTAFAAAFPFGRGVAPPVPALNWTVTMEKACWGVLSPREAFRVPIEPRVDFHAGTIEAQVVAKGTDWGSLEVAAERFDRYGSRGQDE